MRQLHQLLAAVPWLNYQDPGPAGTVYDEETRRAVMDFQISQGLRPSGVVDQQTWDALRSPVPPAAPPGTPDRRDDATSGRLPRLGGGAADPHRRATGHLPDF